MTPDEIVKALRCYASDCGDDDACGQCTFAWMCEEMDGNAPKIIADLIERLNDFEHSQCAVLLARIAELEAQLSESQRRERAAVEDLEYACGSSGEFELRSICDICRRKQTDGTCPTQCEMNSLAASNKWQWRGPQDAGKGAAE